MLTCPFGCEWQFLVQNTVTDIFSNEWTTHCCYCACKSHARLQALTWKESKKCCIGTLTEKSAFADGVAICVVWWYDSRVVSLVSTYCIVEPVTNSWKGPKRNSMSWCSVCIQPPYGRQWFTGLNWECMQWNWKARNGTTEFCTTC